MRAISAARVGKIERPVSQGVRSLEVRWIFRVRWRLRWLSVKVRGGSALELKVYCGSPGILDLAGRARRRMEYWRSGPGP
jgi:hypothetical protein